MVPPGEVFGRVEALFRAHLVWRHAFLPTVLAVWAMGTYFYSLFSWYGYLWFNSPSPRCGKSLALEILSHVCFHATPVTVNPSPAYLYRDVAGACPTVLLDELERSRGLIGLLNLGCKAGGTVARMERSGSGFISRHFHAYSPKAFAGINRLGDTIEDRSFRVMMWRKKSGEQVARFSSQRQETELRQLRDDLYICGLAMAVEVSTSYEQSDTLDLPDRLDDRAKDIFEPLFAIASLVDADRGDRQLTVTRAVRDFALDQAGERASEDRQEIVAVVRALASLGLAEEKKQILTPDAALDLFRKTPDLEWVDTKRKAGRLLHSLGFVSQTHRLRTGAKRGYAVTGAMVRDLVERFLPESSAP